MRGTLVLPLLFSRFLFSSCLNHTGNGILSCNTATMEVRSERAHTFPFCFGHFSLFNPRKYAFLLTKMVIRAEPIAIGKGMEWSFPFLFHMSTKLWRNVIGGREGKSMGRFVNTHCFIQGGTSIHLLVQSCFPLAYAEGYCHYKMGRGREAGMLSILLCSANLCGNHQLQCSVFQCVGLFVCVCVCVCGWVLAGWVCVVAVGVWSWLWAI